MEDFIYPVVAGFVTFGLSFVLPAVLAILIGVVVGVGLYHIHVNS